MSEYVTEAEVLYSVINTLRFSTVVKDMQIVLEEYVYRQIHKEIPDF